MIIIIMYHGYLYWYLLEIITAWIYSINSDVAHFSPDDVPTTKTSSPLNKTDSPLYPKLSYSLNLLGVNINLHN